MKRLLVALTISLLVAVPIVAVAAGGGSARGSLPPAVDQLLAQDMIQLAESHLKIAGFDPGAVDGIFDEQTAAAVRRFQAARGLPVTALLDEPTRRVLLPGMHDAGEE
jgi:peptidoglycan hydrolase-like protein with peptidoglycan-binding domain